MALPFATGAVKIVLGKIADLAVDKVFELRGVRAEVERMRVELTLIEGFLEDVSSKPNNESRAVENWLNELRRVAENIDNKVIETFQKEIPKGKWKGIFKKFQKEIPKGNWKGIFKKPLKLDNISAEIVQNTNILKTLYERGTQLGITARAIATQDPASLPLSSPANNPTVEVPQIMQILNYSTQILNLNTLYDRNAEVGATYSSTATEDPYKRSDVDDPEVVGLESDTRSIIRQLRDQSISRRTVLSIVGIGGLGKTTLAQKIYNSSELEGHFQCSVWQSISQKFAQDNILREILYSIKPQMKEKEKDSPLEDEELVKQVQSCLRDKRYLIILDDVWSTDLWNGLKKALPDVNNSSRVIITTRFLNVARKADHQIDPYKLRFLTNDESVALLFKTALQCDINPENYPVDLKDVSRKLIKKCGGLPLAVVVLGGILSEEEDTLAAWELVYKTMNWHDEDVDKECMKILAMSYEALPNDHLKQCFLYFACFPEDYNISARHMIRLWVVDELIPKDGSGSLEDRAEKCLQELVKRCLVEVTKKLGNGSFKYCRMHDLLRDLALHKVKEINFVTVFSKDGGGGNQQLTPNRVALHSCAPTEFGIHSTNTRSLFCFGKDIPNYQRFGQLRLLVIERVYLSKETISSYKNWLEDLVHLRYLGFRHCRKKNLGVRKELYSISFSRLKILETLDCKGTQIDVNSSLWEIPTLRHVIAGKGSVVQCPLNWSLLKNLQRLDWVRPNSIQTLECDVNLQTLKITIYDPPDFNSMSRDFFANNGPVEEEWQGICALLSKTKQLVSLAIDSKPLDLPFLSVGTRGLSCHETIQSLFLRGFWVRDGSVAISAEMFPKYLTKLKLEDSHLLNDPMPILERLQSLRILHLKSAYEGTKMIYSARGFPSLRKLKFQDMKYLSEWEIEEGAMPVLRHLEIEDCERMETLSELHNVASLQELIVTDASPQLVERSKTEDRQKIEHIPSIRITG